MKPQSNYLWAGLGVLVLALIFVLYFILDRPVSETLAVIVVTVTIMVAGFFLAGPPGNRTWNRKPNSQV